MMKMECSKTWWLSDSVWRNVCPGTTTAPRPPPCAPSVAPPTTNRAGTGLQWRWTHRPLNLIMGKWCVMTKHFPPVTSEKRHRQCREWFIDFYVKRGKLLLWVLIVTEITCQFATTVLLKPVDRFYFLVSILLSISP